MNTRFSSLLLREWLQHRRAWTLLVALPPLLLAAVLAFSSVELNLQADVSTKVSQLPPLGVALLTVVATAALCTLLAWVSVLIQAPGLARRDLGDRSIEFWRSLPVGHAQALASPLLAHLVLFPLAALGAGLLCGLVLSALTVARFHGLQGWLSLPWAGLLGAVLAVGLRFALGLVLATLWLSPLIALVMAASAWLRRWGLPAVVAGVAVLGNVLDKVYGNPLVWDLGGRLLTQASRAMVSGGATLRAEDFAAGDQLLASLVSWAGADAARALQALADPLLPAALAVAAGGFMLLVLRRRHGA